MWNGKSGGHSTDFYSGKGAGQEGKALTILEPQVFFAKDWQNEKQRRRQQSQEQEVEEEQSLKPKGQKTTRTSTTWGRSSRRLKSTQSVTNLSNLDKLWKRLLPAEGFAKGFAWSFAQNIGLSNSSAKSPRAHARLHRGPKVWHTIGCFAHHVALWGLCHFVTLDHKIGRRRTRIYDPTNFSDGTCVKLQLLAVEGELSKLNLSCWALLCSQESQDLFAAWLFGKSDCDNFPPIQSYVNTWNILSKNSSSKHSN